uniref:IBR domain-containing protein n=1 Tax=Meloidogyne incognita TaxID=6306 RepID=A0A914NYC0_MELIC
MSFYIPPNIRRHLNARILEENLGAANVENLERCTQCNFSMIIDIPYQQLRVFSCQKCKAQHCRKCKHAWDDIHFGRNCEDLLNVAEERKQ